MSSKNASPYKKNVMTTKKSYAVLLLVPIVIAIGISCTKLDAKVYSVVQNANFWQTPAEIAAGVAPAYAALTAIPAGNTFEVNEVSSDEIVIPIRGADWLDNNVHSQEWLHNWPVDNQNINGAWNDVYNGIGKANFTLSVVNGLATPPSNLAAINAELKTLRDYYYFLALDMFGNIPYVTSFNVDPSTVNNSLGRAAIYDSIVTDLVANIPLLNTNVDASTYGRVTKWMGFALLAKLYLNAQVYTTHANWTGAMAACDSIILHGPYSLLSNYFDNFAVGNSSILSNGENIFVVPMDRVNIGGNNWEMMSLHYQNNLNFGLSGSPWNGFCSTADYYTNFDTTSVYTIKGSTTYRTYLDQRSGQFLIGQQYNSPYQYPPSTNVVYKADPSTALQDLQFSIPLLFTPLVGQISNAAGSFRMAGLRSIKYFPEAGTAGGQSNDMVIFRLSDIYLMRAEADLRANGTMSATSLGYVNLIRERAYGGDASHDWTAPQATLTNLLAERARELSWEGWRRNDLIRFEVASGTHYFSAARTPDKTQDADSHWQLFPIPKQQITANPNLVQNQGY